MTQRHWIVPRSLFDSVAEMVRVATFMPRPFVNQIVIDVDDLARVGLPNEQPADTAPRVRDGQRLL